jgi:translocation and assembly module TamB
VVLTASWTTPDRSRKILAEFIGPLKSGTFTLRSEPKLSQSQILSLLLFGTPSGLDGSPANRNRQAQASSSAAAGIGAALAAGPLNNALSSAVRADIQATVDTTRSNPRPGVKVGISKDVSAQMSFVWGTPPPGQPPDRYYVALDWRLVRNWFLKASVGDRGATATDVMWQHKY